MPAKKEITLKDLTQYKNIDFLAKKAVEGFITGLHRSPYKGFSVEFAEHKAYNSGDSTRHIDWKVYGRTDKLFLKSYQEETNLRCHILIDVSSSMYYPEKENSKLHFSLLSSAALAVMLQKQRDAIGITTFSEEIEHSTAVKSTRSHLQQLTSFLQSQLEAEENHRFKKSGIEDAINKLAMKVPGRSLIILFSDFFLNDNDNEKFYQALQHLRHYNHEIILFHVMDHKHELEFDFEQRPYEFTDIETGEKMKLNPHLIKDNYKAQMQAYMQNLKLKCGMYKIDYVSVDINQSLDQILWAYLVKRSKMK